MAADSYGSRGEPQFAGSGASADAEDLTLLGEHAAEVGNRKVGTDAQRVALNASATNPVEVWEGMQFFCTDTGVTWLRHNSAWDFYDWDSGWVNLTASGGNGWEAGTGTNVPQIRRVGHLVVYRGQFAGGTANTTASILPGWARPNKPLMKPVTLSTLAPGYVRCFTSGAFQPSGPFGPETEIQWVTDASV